MEIMNSGSATEALRAGKLEPEPEAIAALIAAHPFSARERAAIVAEAKRLLLAMRTSDAPADVVQTFFQDMDLGSPEGLALMALAEALLRVPDAATAEALIQEKLAQGDWNAFRARADGVAVKALGVMMDLAATITAEDSLALKAAGRVTLPAIRTVAGQVIQLMASRFVFAPTIEDAVRFAARNGAADRYSLDMLGEGARTMRQAAAFGDSYHAAITALGRAVGGGEAIAQPSISVKLSALHPRFEPAQADRVRAELFPILADLAATARATNIALTIDAEEADRLELTLEALAHLAGQPQLRGWDGLGLAVQAYAKRTPRVIDWLDALGRQTGRRLNVRLVKGAYWDAEIKHAQVEGLASYPVYTHKAATDLAYIACAQSMLAADRIVPQFATHNVHTVTAIRHLAGAKPFEFQRLHGMGERLYGTLRQQGLDVPVRVYAPVGQFRELLPYLVRRMLENTANSSFVRVALDPHHHVDDIIHDPVALPEQGSVAPVPLPGDIYRPRRNAVGVDLADTEVLQALSRAARGVTSKETPAGGRVIRNPADRRRTLGTVLDAAPADVSAAIAAAERAFPAWSARPAADRAAVLERAADLYEAHFNDFVALIVAEAGRTLRDAVAEVREAVDFCRYYAAEARRLFQEVPLPGVTGERNTLVLEGRGVFACISPWNFPLAIFTGQIVAALVAGNAVVAKPAEQTPLVAAFAIGLLHQAGVPRETLHLLQGDAVVGRAITADPRIAGVAFTGSTAAAQAINRALAARDGAIGTLIAETGGVNAMFVDSSALPEQVVDDVIASGLLSAGQRCSSLRHLFLPEERADAVLDLLSGAMDMLRIGDPADPATDVGPLIDADACAAVETHIAAIQARGARIVKQCVLGEQHKQGSFVAPTLIELPSPELLDREVFGPVVHVSRWARGDLDRVLAGVRGKGFGLTLGIHSRRARFAEQVEQAVRCGNTYVNRNMIGAVVGAQPFGGCNLSGTGPKAGGPHYLPRFTTERTVTVNLTAIGGDTALLA